MTNAGPAAGPLILDLQALQSLNHRDRGIGRWAFEFTKALCELRPDLVGALVLNPDLPEPTDLGVLGATGKVTFAGQSDVPPAGIYHLLSPFELDQPLERIWPAHPARLVVTLYDLIPEVFPDRYLADPGQRRRYRARLETLRAADRVLAISESSRDDAVARLGLDPAKVISIGTGIAPAFTRPASRADALDAARRGMPRLEESFLFCVGGEDDRKNVEGLLRAFALLPEEHRARHQLVVAFRLTEGYRAHLQTLARRLGIASRLYLPGYIDDATLIAAYQATELFVFPSLYEGFGLPVAEAMACGAPVVSSNTSAPASLTPMAGQFNPLDSASIAEAIGRALTDPATAAALRKASERPARTWREVAEAAVQVYEGLLSEAPVALRLRGRRRLRVAFVTPLPPQRTGVAIYGYRLIEALLPRCEVDVFLDALEGGIGSLPASPRGPDGVAIHPVERFERVEAARGGYDAVVYAIGNSQFHTGALGLARKRPGIVLAHEVRLPQLYAFAAHHGMLEPDSFASIHAALYPGAAPPPDPLLIDPTKLNALPESMAGDLIAHSEAFLTTSEFAARWARNEAVAGGGERVGVLPHALRIRPRRPEPGECLVASFGVVNPTKSTGLLLEAFAIVLRQRPRARLALVGYGSQEDLAAVRGMAVRLGINAAVTATGEVDAETWDSYLAQSAVAVQLRATTNGEFSGAVAETLAAGVPTIVSAIGSAAELPDEAAVKLAPDATADPLAGEIVALLGDAAPRAALAAGARAYAATRSFDIVAAQLCECLRRVREG